MASFRIKVPNDDEGEDLGEYQSDYLPRVGEPFFLWHPRLGFDGSDGDHPFCGIVSEVVHEAQYAANGVERSGHPVSVVTTTVWLTEEHGAPKLFCDCSEDERKKYDAVDGECQNCGHRRRA